MEMRYWMIMKSTYIIFILYRCYIGQTKFFIKKNKRISIIFCPKVIIYSIAFFLLLFELFISFNSYKSSEAINDFINKSKEYLLKNNWNMF